MTRIMIDFGEKWWLADGVNISELTEPQWQERYEYRRGLSDLLDSHIRATNVERGKEFRRKLDNEIATDLLQYERYSEEAQKESVKPMSLGQWLESR